MRSRLARTCVWLTTLWCSQLAMCWLEIRRVARSSIRPTLWMSGTLEQPTPCSTQRSEEHTSELQSLMRISYAVFCLKKKNNKNRNNQELALNKVHTQVTNTITGKHLLDQTQTKPTAS